MTGSAIQESLPQVTEVVLPEGANVQGGVFAYMSELRYKTTESYMPQYPDAAIPRTPGVSRMPLPFVSLRYFTTLSSLHASSSVALSTLVVRKATASRHSGLTLLDSLSMLPAGHLHTLLL